MGYDASESSADDAIRVAAPVLLSEITRRMARRCPIDERRDAPASMSSEGAHFAWCCGTMLQFHVDTASKARELGVGDHDKRESGTKALHRMIAYLRDEALRLHIMDVALLLGHAGDAVADFSTAAVRKRRGEARERQGSLVEH